ncbi:hypothetical protein BG006_008704 [Podila minutissima]|uniref:Uncharacterized protein n=1 Tax=Podila minutissima TaxID=64525 RepID=A0A9P5VPU4_9FUNG|nr:hypothetical protein BG006_008704 [Podila minutissima]
MLSMIRTSVAKTPARCISTSAPSRAATVAIAHSEAVVSTSSRTKTVAYAVLGSTAVVAGASHVLKDEVVYWTPNARK